MSTARAIIRLRLDEATRAPAATLARVEAALQRLPRSAAFLELSHEGERDMLVRFGLGANPQTAWRTVSETLDSLGVRAEVCVWSGCIGTATFGDTPERSERLIGLILSGHKRACCGALAEYLLNGELIPEVGTVLTVLDHRGVPTLRYRTTEVFILPFDKVPERFALLEGEGSFADWRREHEAYFARTSGFDPNMPIVCEVFEVLETFRRPGAAQARRR